MFSATKYEMSFDKSRSSLETGHLVEDRLLPRPAEAGAKQTCIVRIPEKNEIFHYSIVAIDQVHFQNVCILLEDTILFYFTYLNNST